MSEEKGQGRGRGRRVRHEGGAYPLSLSAVWPPPPTREPALRGPSDEGQLRLNLPRMTSPQRTCLGADARGVPWGGAVCGRGFPLLQGSAHGRPCRLWVRQSPWHSWEDDTSGTSPGRAPCRAAKRPGPMGGAAVRPRELPKGPAPAVTGFPKSSGFKQVHYLTALEVRNPKSVLGANNVWAGRAGSFRGL